LSERARDVAIVGGGVAGCTAALYARRYGLDTLVLERAVLGGQAAVAVRIENYPGFPEGISGAELAQRIHEQAAKLGVEFVTAEVKGLARREDGTWLLHTDAEPVQAIAVIVATGAAPRRLRIPGEQELLGLGVSYCATCDGFFFRGRPVAVIGGGNTALEEALYLADLCPRVYVVHRRDALRADQYLQVRAAARANIEFVWDSVAVEVLGREQVEGLRIRNVKTNEERVLEVSGVFVAIGHEAQTEWLGSYVERNNGFIVTNERMETASPGLFAAGDVRDRPVRQITTAIGDATVAAYYAYYYVADFKARQQA
jgi:thioredoxin reductase (NADPH)